MTCADDGDRSLIDDELGTIIQVDLGIPGADVIQHNLTLLDVEPLVRLDRDVLDIGDRQGTRAILLEGPELEGSGARDGEFGAGEGDVALGVEVERPRSTGEIDTTGDGQAAASERTDGGVIRRRDQPRVGIIAREV